MSTVDGVTQMESGSSPISIPTRIATAVRRVAAAITLIAVVAAFVVWQNTDITVSEYRYESPAIPAGFDGFRITQVSDLHNKRFGAAQSALLSKLAATKPDVIVVTGDLIDRRSYDLEAALELARGAVSIAPTYFVSGNHEAWSGRYEDVASALTLAGVTVLDDRKVALRSGTSSIDLVGVADPDFMTDSYLDGTDSSGMRASLSRMVDPSAFTVLLSHRPELVDLYRQAAVDLTFTGHAHGGQFRIPGLGGLVAPDQGWFPAYSSGRYDVGDTTMYVSRGLGNSVVPVRIFNRPELVVVTLVR